MNIKNKMTLDDWAKEIHDNAFRKGLWDEDKPFSEIVALCHSDLSKALDKHLKGGELIYISGEELKGVAANMMGCVMRILDWMKFRGIYIDELMAIKHSYDLGIPCKHSKRY